MVAGDVGVHADLDGDRRRGDPVGAAVVAGEQVDAAPRRVAEGVGDRRDRRGERRRASSRRRLPRRRAREPWSAGPSRYSTYGRSANSRRPPPHAARPPRRNPMPVTRDQIIDALRPVEDPELHRSIVDLGMVRSIDPAADGSASACSGRPDRARLPAEERDHAAASRPPWSPSTASRSSSVDFTVMTDQEREALRVQLQGERPRPRPRPAPRPRRGSGDPVRPARLAHPSAVHLVGQGRRRQVQRHRQPRRRPGRPRPLGRHPRRRHLRLLDPPHARRRSRADRDRRDAAAARGLGRALHLDRLLRARGPGRRVAGTDAAQGARAVPHRRVLGRPRVPARRHAARHRRHRHLAQPVPALAARCSS